MRGSTSAATTSARFLSGRLPPADQRTSAVLGGWGDARRTDWRGVPRATHAGQDGARATDWKVCLIFIPDADGQQLKVVK